MRHFVKNVSVFLVILLAVCLTACTDGALQQIGDAIAPALEQAVINELDSSVSDQQAPPEATAALPTVAPEAEEAEAAAEEETGIVYGNDYSTPEDVAAYLNTFHELPPNYITKDEAKDMGWDSYEGNLYEVTGGLSIGGDYFSNYQRILPTAHGRKYYECDVNYYGGFRGAERLVYSNDGLIYYTGDHYNTFTLLYGEE